MKIPVMLIHWVDSTYFQYEGIAIKDIPTDNQHSPRSLLTVGILIDETNDYITICQCVDEQFEFTRKVLSIPKFSIISDPICIDIDVDLLNQKKKEEKKSKK